jgi:oxygen-independent coproporphyrinogen-3 oxidase
MRHNIYIHVPFCTSKCGYCAFHSTVATPGWTAYKNKIISEIKFWSEKLDRPDVPTIFFGGGTPSLMPINIFADIMTATRANFNIAADAEITLESNPGTLDTGTLFEFIAAGANRLSVGVQSLDDDILSFLGRTHSAAMREN